MRSNKKCAFFSSVVFSPRFPKTFTSRLNLKVCFIGTLNIKLLGGKFVIKLHLFHTYSSQIKEVKKIFLIRPRPSFLSLNMSSVQLPALFVKSLFTQIVFLVKNSTKYLWVKTYPHLFVSAFKGLKFQQFLVIMGQ